VAFEIGPLFGFGPLEVRWYGIMYLVGFALGWLGARSHARQPWSRIKPEHVDDIVFYVALGAIVGGRFGYMLIYGLSELIADPLSIFKVWQGGMSFHGGFIGVLTAMWLYGRYIKQPFFVVMDFVAPWTAFGLCAGRIGNFINGELWGKPTDVPWGFLVDGEVRHATQLYEAALEGLLLAIALWWFTSKPRPRMAPVGLFLIIYSIARIFVEFWRLPDEHLNAAAHGYLAGGWLTMGMLLSLPMLLIGATLFFMAYRRREPSGNVVAAAAG
jgi:phosphatidylglycerol:prolipoprotein diacylglycerol transferase